MTSKLRLSQSPNRRSRRLSSQVTT